MAKDKNLASNPVQAYHKKTKQAVINKARSDRLKQRDQQLQKRRPDQVQRQIDELIKLRDAGRISSDDQQVLSSLERDLVRINRLRAENRGQPLITSERLQQKAQHGSLTKKIPKDPTKSYYYDPIYNPFGVPPPGMDYREVEHSGSETDSSTTSSTAQIPLPTDPCPDDYPELPKETDATTRRKHAMPNTKKFQQVQVQLSIDGHPSEKDASQGNVYTTSSVTTPSKVVYSAAPVLRDLRQESTAFVPNTLKRKVVPRRASPARDPMVQHLTELADADDAPSTAETAQNGRHSLGKRRVNLAPTIN